MLNFSKINVIIIYLIFFFISIFSLLNLQTTDKTFLEKKVNLGLDLQGGSYLLLEINSDSLVEEKIQSKVIPLKKLLKDNGLNYQDFKIKNKNLSFKIDDINKFDLLFFSKKDNLVNPYIENYRSFELEYKKKKDMYQTKKATNTCPDYWQNVSPSQDKLICRNVKNLGRFNFTRDMDFSIPLYKDDVNKCKYAKQARISWEGVDKLCA